MHRGDGPGQGRPGPARRALDAAARYARPATWAHVLKQVNFYAYAHVEERRKMTTGPGLRLSPSVSLRNAERIVVGRDVHVGERSSIWAGNTHGRVVLGDDVLLGPEVYITASNYGTRWGTPVVHQDTVEADVIVRDGAWLGVRSTLLPGVTVGEGAVIGAGAVVTKDVPAGAIAVGVPARVVGYREGFPGAAQSDDPEALTSRARNEAGAR